MQTSSSRRGKNSELKLTFLDKGLRKSDEKKFLDRILLGIRNREVDSVSAFADEKVIGTCDVFRRRTPGERHTELLGIVILDGYRRPGIGQMMVMTALEDALRSGIWPVELQVLAINHVAIHIYEKRGFKSVRVVPGKISRMEGIWTKSTCMST